jgi:hypothetical protein
MRSPKVGAPLYCESDDLQGAFDTFSRARAPPAPRIGDLEAVVLNARNTVAVNFAGVRVDETADSELGSRVQRPPEHHENVT